ncbi:MULTISPECIES: NADPH-dependent FMN reductase [unclassified Xanthobacter]|uniref:NADPH-dependent FMN reductase n=1 Tax=unclassified Xanthobacter TaxID=2623496 RepID=UPI001EDDAABD|nr:MULTISPECIES: NADPH-dependent FMN reductase [unclassified Xanthobacter]
MKWVVLVGSVRKGSFNAAVARALAGIAPEGVSVELLPSIAQLPIYDGDIEAAGIPDSVAQLATTVAAADALVIVTPEYNYSIPGGLKNAIDWLSRVPTKPLKGKPALIQSASMGVIGGARAQYHLRQVLVCLDMAVMNVPEVMVGGVHTKVTDGVLTDQGTLSFIEGQLAAFHDFVRKHKLAEGA